jgi:hypothetical protein
LAQSRFMPNHARPSGGRRLGGVRGSAPSDGSEVAAITADAGADAGKLGVSTLALQAARSSMSRMAGMRDIGAMLRAVTARTNGPIVPVARTRLAVMDGLPDGDSRRGDAVRPG